MKGIVLAGGKGTRLHPLTASISKQLMPIYDKPMIYYPISTLIEAGIREILIISTPADLPLFQRLLGDGTQWGCTFDYAEQAKPKGLADAFLIGESFIDQSPVVLILGDNLFHGASMSILLERLENRSGGHIFAYKVKDPQRYGVVHFDNQKTILSIEEKQTHPKSFYAIPGIYFYDASVVKKAKALTPSVRGELEITDINRAYLEEGTLEVSPLDAGVAWLDTGTVESLMEASQYVRALQERQGVLVGSPEMAAFTSGAIDKHQLQHLARQLGETSYGKSIVTFSKQ